MAFICPNFSLLQPLAARGIIVMDMMDVWAGGGGSWAGGQVFAGVQVPDGWMSGAWADGQIV